MRNLLSILLASLLAFNAAAVNVTVYPRDVTAGSPAYRNVTVTLLSPSGPVVSGPWLFTGDAVTLNTGTNGSVTFSNMLVLGEYSLAIQGNPGRSYPFSISSTSVTNNAVNVVQLIGTNVAVQTFYDVSQVDALMQQARFNNSNYVNQAVTNAVIGQFVFSNNYNGTFSGPVAGAASSATNALLAGTATNAFTATNSLFSSTATNAITATNSLFASTATNAITATNALFAGTATNAITSTNSLFAGTATNAITATNALFAGTATNAITSTNSLFASTATNAITATNSLFSGTATNAITSTNALFSGTATNAITSTNGALTGFASVTLTNSGMLQSSNGNVTALMTASNLASSLVFANLFPSTNLLVSGIAPTNGGAGKFVGWTAGGGVWTNPPTSTSTTGTNIFYVSPTGLSVNSGLSTLSPWPLQYALNQIQPGWTLLLMDGYYDASTNNPGPNSTFVFSQTAGTPANYMTIRAINKWQAVIGGGTNGGIAASSALGFRTAGVIFDGLKVANNPGDGIGAWQYSIIRNCWIATNGMQGINMSSSLSASNIVERNVIEWNGTNTANAGHYHDIYAAGPGHIIRGNVIRYAQTGYGLQTYTGDSGQSNNWDQVYNNLIYGNTNFGYGVISFNYQDTGAGVSPGTNYFYNNTILDGIRVRGGGSVIQNNIILANVLNPTTPINTLGTPAVTVYSDYNLWTNTSGQVGALITPGAHEVFTNTTAAALFVNPAKGLMWLPSTSPARAVGTNYPTGQDWLGNPQAIVSDVGAYQYFPNWPAADTRTLDPSSYPDYWSVQPAFIAQTVPTSTLYAALATNLVTAPNLTNPTVYVTPSGNLTFTYSANAQTALLIDHFGDVFLQDTNGVTLLQYSAGGALTDLLELGTESGFRLVGNGLGTQLFDQGNGRRVNVSTNRVDVNTNLNAWAITVTNNLTVSGSITGATLSATSATISNIVAVPISADNLTVTNGVTNSSLTASTMLLADANKRVVSLANASLNNVLHSTPSGPPFFSAVTAGDMLLGAETTANATTLVHGFMPQGDGNANHFFNGSIALTTIPDGAHSANVTLDNAANPFTGLNTFGQLSKMDSLSVTNGLTNQFLTANAMVYSDANKRLQSVAAGGASQYLKAGTPPAFATIQASDISGSIPFSGVATAANALTSGGVGTNNVFWTDAANSNALYTTGKWITMSNSAGTVQWNGGNQTNSGVVQATQFLGPNGQVVVGGAAAFSTPGNAIMAGGATLTGSSGTQGGMSIAPVIQQSGSAGYSILSVNAPIVTTGSGVQDIQEWQSSGTVVARIDINGDQTNSGNVKASAFYGPLHGNADTASSVASANSAGVANTLVSGALTTNTVTQILGSSGGQSSAQWLYPSGLEALQIITNGQVIINDLNGAPVFAYSGAPFANETVSVGKDNGYVLFSDRTRTTLYDGTAAARVTITNIVNVTGPFNYQLNVIPKTANYTVATGDSGAYFNNNGSVGAITNTLPAAAAGLHYSFAVVTAQNIAIKASGSDFIRSVGNISVPGGIAFSSTLGATLHLFCPASGGWWIDSTNGTWTIQ